MSAYLSVSFNATAALECRPDSAGMRVPQDINVFNARHVYALRHPTVPLHQHQDSMDDEKLSCIICCLT